MSDPACVLLIFASIHHVLAAEKALVAAGLTPDLVPVPKEIHPNCGMAVTVAPAERGPALEALAANPPIRILDDWRP